MEIKKLTLQLELKSKDKSNVGVWSGSKLRSAIKNGIAYAHCINLEHGACDKCRRNGCANKFLFDVSTEDKARMSCNPIILDCQFSDEAVITDTVNITISLLGRAIQVKESLIDVLKCGIFIGADRNRFILSSYTEELETINIESLSEADESKRDTALKIKFETPFVTKSQSGLTLESFIRNCTTRITSVVNTLELDYNVEYQRVLDSLSNIQEVELLEQDKYYGKMSSRTRRFNTIHGRIGEITIKGDLSEAYKYIELASKLNIGKYCTMGFGKFSITEQEV